MIFYILHFDFWFSILNFLIVFFFFWLSSFFILTRKNFRNFYFALIFYTFWKRLFSPGDGWSGRLISLLGHDLPALQWIRLYYNVSQRSCCLQFTINSLSFIFSLLASSWAVSIGICVYFFFLLKTVLYKSLGTRKKIRLSRNSIWKSETANLRSKFCNFNDFPGIVQTYR